MIPNYEVSGPPEAHPLLLVNSLGADLGMWEPQLAALSAAHRVIRYDARGHGRSPVPPGPYTLADLGRDALDLLDHLGIARAHVCGLSLGGMTAMWLAAHFPGRVDRLVLLCTSALLGPPSDWAARARTVLDQGTEAVADAVVDRWLTPAAAPSSRARLRAMIAATPAAGYAGACGAIETMDLRADLPRITAPTLVVSGARDPATPPPHGSAIAAAVPGARFVTVPGAHLASWEHPTVINKLILEALGG